MSYEVALDRVGRDPERGISKDPGFLRWTHEEFARRAQTLPPFHLEFDTTLEPIEEIADIVVNKLLS